MSAGTAAADVRPLVMHVLHRFDTGGLENGVVNLINRLPRGRWRHMVVALTEVTDFRLRLADPDVACMALHKPPGHGLRVYPALWKLIRAHRPAIVHTRNLAALEMQPVAWAAGVPGRVHGEHGRDADDLDGSSRRHRRIRRVFAPFVQRYVTVSRELQDYLISAVGIAPGRVQAICNGVDAERFAPPAGGASAVLPGCPFEPGRHWLVGAVGRLQTVKNQALLARAFARAVAGRPAMRDDARLVIVGEGGHRPAIESALAAGGVSDLTWLAGERRDVPEVLRALDVFVLPSLAEGISNTILEAMSCGRPVIASRVGGNAELVADGITGELFDSGDEVGLAARLQRHHAERGMSRAMGAAARARVLECFSLEGMVAAYDALYAAAAPPRYRSM